MSEDYIPCEICDQYIDSRVYYAHLLLCSSISSNVYIQKKNADLFQLWTEKYPKMPVLEKTECSICFERCKFIKIFPCLHEFCNMCSDIWVKKQIEQEKKIECPKCRACVHFNDNEN